MMTCNELCTTDRVRKGAADKGEYFLKYEKLPIHRTNMNRTRIKESMHDKLPMPTSSINKHERVSCQYIGRVLAIIREACPYQNG